MASLKDLKDRIKNYIAQSPNKIDDKLLSFGKKTAGTLKNVGSDLANEFKAQQQVKFGANPQTGRIGDYNSSFPGVIQNKTVNTFKALSTPEGQERFNARPSTGAFEPLKQYVGNRYIAPLAQTPYNFRQLTGKDKTPLQRGAGALGVAGGVATALPDPFGDILLPAFDLYKGAKANMVKTGGGLLTPRNLKAGIPSLTGQKYTGIGETLPEGTPEGARTAANIAELPVMLGAGMVSAKNTKNVARILENKDNIAIAKVYTRSLEKMDPAQSAKAFGFIIKKADELVPEFMKAKEMKRLKLQDPVEWAKRTVVFMEDKLASAQRPELNLGLSTKPIKRVEDTFDSNKYISDQVTKQKLPTDKISIGRKLDSTLQSIKTKFEDFTTPIETALNRSEKAGKFKILPQNDIRYQIDKVLRADSLGTQFVKDNGLENVIKNTDNLDNLNQYLIAKQATAVTKKGIKTGRDITSDQQLIKSLGSKYEPVAQEIYSYNAKLRDYLVQSGLISEDLSKTLAKEYPNYVPLKRVFTEAEQAAMSQVSGRGGPASIGSQNVIKKLKGSERDIVNPLESLLENTGLAFREGERNKGASMLAKYVKDGIIPGTEVKGSTSAKHTFSFLDAGKKRVFEVSPEIATAAKNLNADQLSKALRIIAIPTRMLQLGATGMNVPFVLGNLVKDQVTASVISKKPLSTSIANPLNFVKAAFESVKHGDVYDNWVRSGSSASTSFDIARGSAPNTIESIRSGRSVASKIKYVAKNPSQILRALEDVIGTTENLTRIQQYSGTKQALLKEGRTAADADILAGAASRTNTANFPRKGEYGKVLNSIIPFFNAGIQGARSLRQAFTSDPMGTSLRFTASVGLPITAATLWNLSNYERKAAYDDIPEYEKENNIIIMPEKPVKDADGNYNAIKIPVTPGLSNLMSIMRRQVEGVGVNAQEAMKVLSDLTAANTSFELPIDSDSTRQLAGQMTPQAIKLVLEPTLNKNFFTGADIVPSYMKNKPPEEQVRDNTSGTARILGKALNASPLQVENTISSGGAGTGRQLLNLSDRILSSSGKIPEDQVGGRSITEDVKRRFIKVRGGEKVNQLYEAGLNKKQIEKLMEEEKATTAKFSNSREKSPEAPKTILDKIKLASKAITRDPRNTIKALFTEEVMRKITNDALIFERKTNINPGTEGYHVDHTIPLSLGGDNSPENLVVYEKEAKAKKDKLESQLWRQLDSGEITKKEAQTKIKEFIDSNGAGNPIVKTSKGYIKIVAEGKESKLVKIGDPIKSTLGGQFEITSDTGSVRKINLDTPIMKPVLTGQKDLDKKLISSYKSKLTSRSSQIRDLYESGQITAEQAQKEIALIESQRTTASGGAKIGKAKKLTKFTMPKPRQSATPGLTKSKLTTMPNIKIASIPKFKIGSNKRRYTKLTIPK